MLLSWGGVGIVFLGYMEEKKSGGYMGDYMCMKGDQDWLTVKVDADEGGQTR